MTSPSEQRTEAWYKAREGMVTGSKVGAILGINPWRSRTDVLHDMLYGRKNNDQNLALIWGTELEPYAKGLFETITGFDVEEAFFDISSDYEWLGASPDGYIGEHGLIEIKCPFRMRNDGAKHKTIDEQPYYYAQMQVQMLCSDKEYCHFFQWGPPDKVMLEIVPRDDKYISEIIPILHDFYLEFIEKRDYRESIPPKPNGDKKMAIENYDEILARYMEINSELKELKEEQSGLKDLLIESMTSDSIESKQYKVTRFTKAGGISYAAVVKEHLPNLDLEPYRGKPSVQVRVTQRK